MADYNPNTVSAYQQYASSMSSGGGGSNMSGLGARSQTSGTPSSRFDSKGYTPTKSTSTKSGIAYIEGYGDDNDNIPMTPEQIYTAAAQATTEVGGFLVPTIDAPMIHAANLYSMPNMVQQVSDYVYRADRDTAVREAISGAQAEEQASVDAAISSINRAITQGKTDAEIAEAFLNDMGGMGSDKPDESGGFGVPGVTLKDVTDTQQGLMTNPQPLYDFADEMANPSITTTELPPMSPEEQASLGAAIRKAAEEGTLSSKLTNLQYVRSDGNKMDPSYWDKVFSEGYDPMTGKPYGQTDLFPEDQPPEDYNEADYIDVSPSAEAPEQQGLMSRPSFTESQPEDSMLGGLFNIIPDAFQVSNWLTGGNQLDGTQGEEPSPEPELGPEQGPILYPSNERSVITYARDIYPDNPKAAAALAATIQFEGMEKAEEDVSSYSWKNITSSSSPAGWLKKSITDSNKPWAKKRTNKLYQLYGGKPKTDADGNTIPLTREPTKEELKAVQRELKKRGLYKGAIDGIFGRGSKAALKEFQGIQNSTALSGDYPKMPENGGLDEYTAMFFDVELRLYDHKGSPMIEYERPTNPVVPAGEKVVDITYNPYYRANGYSDQLRDVSKEGLEGNTPGAGTFRGRGPVQITNKTMYEKLSNKVLSETGVDIMRNPSAVANDLAVSKAATAAFLNEVGFDKLSPKEALKVINPQMPSSKLNKRLEAYEKYLEEMQE